ncbi:MAG TPA: trigger factor [bacterium]|nr:trigger factor [bacterium]
MNISLKNLPLSEMEITIIVLPKEYEKFMLSAARQLSETLKLEGFRPGHAPYDIVRQKIGATAILEHALSEIITHTFIEAVNQKELNTLGQPEINVQKMAPDNDLIYTAKVTILPAITLPDLNDLSLPRPDVSVDDQEVTTFLEQLAKSRATEILEARPAKNDDLVKLDYQISLAGVPQENATQKDFAVFLGEHHMVPGFEEQIIGLSAGKQKSFSLPFPKDYFQKNFAGKTCDFTITVKGVYRLDVPEINDAFAKSLGRFQNLAELKKQITNNLTLEKQNKADRKLENDLLKLVIEKITFPELPEKLIENELHLMMHELEDDLAGKGLSLATWLTNMNKTEDEFKKDLRPQAELRAKSILTTRAIIQAEKIKAEEQEIDLELKKITDLYSDNDELLSQVKSKDYRGYLAQSIANKKVIDWLKGKIVK